MKGYRKIRTLSKEVLKHTYPIPTSTHLFPGSEALPTPGAARIKQDTEHEGGMPGTQGHSNTAFHPGVPYWRLHKSYESHYAHRKNNHLFFSAPGKAISRGLSESQWGQ